MVRGFCAENDLPYRCYPWHTVLAKCIRVLQCPPSVLDPKRFDSTRWLFREYSKPVSLPKAVVAKSDLLTAFNRRGQRLPFTGRYMEVIARKQNTDPPPSQLVSGVPGDLEDLCLALLHRDPAARPTGRQIIERLGNKSVPVVEAPAGRN